MARLYAMQYFRLCSFLRLKINKEKSYVLFSYVFFFATYNL